MLKINKLKTIVILADHDTRHTRLITTSHHPSDQTQIHKIFSTVETEQNTNHHDTQRPEQTRDMTLSGCEQCKNI